MLGSGPGGLSSLRAEQKLIETGPNEIQDTKKKSWWVILVSQFKDLMIIILVIAVIISGLIGDITDTIFILLIILLNALLGFFQEYRAEQAMQALKRMAASEASVLRDGAISCIDSKDLVTGDIVMLQAGKEVAADVRIIESFQLKAEEAALTGESIGIDKTSEVLKTADVAIGDRKNMCFKGTFISAGRGRGIVVATGMQTELGNIAKLLHEEQPITPLQHRMVVFGKRLSLLVIFLCVVFFIIGCIRGEDFNTMILSSVSLAVAAIPEALPAVITVSLALAAKRMVRFNSLVRRLPAVETLGSVTYICTDKTGTLTKNKMQVEQLFVNGHLYQRHEISGVKDEQEIALLLHAFALNNDACIQGEQELTGDSTEIALMEVAMEENISADGSPRLDEITFDAERKLMTTFHLYHGKIISFTKGAPDLLLERCEHMDGPMILKQVNRMAAKGYRVLGFAYRYWDTLPSNPQSNNHEKNLRFLGLAAMADIPREEAAAAVQQCLRAGIVPVLITGDYLLTAKAIALQLGILKSESDKVINGPELAQLSDDDLLSQVENIKVYARVSPEQKLRIIKALQKKGHCVAMTGDGVNDAPSLKRANIGIAMGVTGTDVAKEASHMILLDDNFSTIVKAIREGRRVYDNIRKFIKYLMTTNSGELWTLLLGPVIGLPVALLPIHILWINLVSDGLPAVALSFEKAEKDIMLRNPRPVSESIFANGMGLHIIWVGLLMAAVSLFVQAWSLSSGSHWQTIVFNVICLSQMGHLLAIRSEKKSLFSIGLFSNKYLLTAVCVVLGLQIAVTYIPVLQPIFKTQSLPLTDFLIVGAASSLLFIAVEIEKTILRAHEARA